MTIIFVILSVCLFKLSRLSFETNADAESHNLFNIVRKGRYSILALMIAGTAFSSCYMLVRISAPPPESIVIFDPVEFYINFSASITGILFFTILTVWMDVLKFISIARNK
jgi:hypothetical protein